VDIKRLTTQASLRAFRPDTRRGPQGPALASTRPAPLEPTMLQIEPGSSRELLADQAEAPTV
jgi:hypothetical protein